MNLKFKIPNNRRGFTLIEILVAVGIMSLVFGLVITSASSIRRRARDQQRITDLQTLQQALAAYHADQGFFPDGSFNLGSSTTQLTDDSGNPLTATVSKTYLTKLPKDPQSFDYCYKPLTRITDLTTNCSDSVNSHTTCQSYVICTHYEGALTSPSVNCPMVCGSSAPVSAQYNYEVNPEHSTTQ